MQQYRWRLIKWGVGLLSLYLDVRLRKKRYWRPLDIVLIDSIMRRLLPRPDLRAFPPKDHTQYEAVISRTKYWHGTGRLQYDQKRGTIDVLERLLRQHGLRPFKDVFDVTQGKWSAHRLRGSECTPVYMPICMCMAGYI